MQNVAACMKQRRSICQQPMVAASTPYYKPNHQQHQQHQSTSRYYDESLLLLEMSDSSLTYIPSEEERSINETNSVATQYAVKAITLLLIGFAGGLLYHLLLATSLQTLWTTGQPDDMPNGLLTDELVKNLASESQLLEQEIQKLKQQVWVQDQQRQMLLRMGATSEAEPKKEEEKVDVASTVETPPSKATEQSRPLQEVHPPNEAILVGRLNAETGLFEMYDHNEHVYKPVQKRRKGLRVQGPANGDEHESRSL